VSRTPDSAIAEEQLCAHTATKVTQQPDHAPDEYAIPENIGEIRIFPRPIVWTAGMVILALAVIGLVQGIRGALTGGAAGGSQEEMTTGGAVSAQAAQPLSGTAQWSALSGAAIASSSAASAAPAPATSSSDESQNESSDETPTVSAAPPPPPAPNPQPAAAAPEAQPQSAQPDTMPPT
jgi:hypothetical protein